MKIYKTGFDELYVLQGERFSDSRGFLREIFKKNLVKEKMVFSVVSSSKRNVIRGLHIQKKNSQAKFVTVIKGEILDVAVDLRKNSKTFGKHFKIVLNDRNSKFLFIPKGFAHGFLTLEDDTVFQYKVDRGYSKSSERGVLWSDEELDIQWPAMEIALSDKDKCLPRLRDI